MESQGVGCSGGRPDKVSIGEVTILETAILDVVPRPVAKLDAPKKENCCNPPKSEYFAFHSKIDVRGICNLFDIV